MGTLLLSLLLLTALSAARPVRAADWPQLLGPARDGVYSGDDLTFDWGPSGPPVRWSVNVGHGFGGPVVAGDTVVLFHQLGEALVLDALDAATGERRWRRRVPSMYRDRFGFGDGPRATPTIAGGRVFAFDPAGRLLAVSLDDGRALWGVETHRRFRADPGYFGAACSPLVVGDRVLVNVGGEDAGIVAFDAETGEVLWEATDHDASYASPIVSRDGETATVLFFTRWGLVELEPKRGRVLRRFRWRARIDASVNAALPVPVGDRVFVSASYSTGAVLLDRTDDGFQPVWQSKEVLSNHYNTTLHHQGTLYGVDGRQEAKPDLRAVRAADGEVLWSVERFGAAHLLRAGDAVLALGEDGQLTVFAADPERFRQLARAKLLRAETRAVPALAGGVLYARDAAALTAFDLSRPAPRPSPKAAKPPG